METKWTPGPGHYVKYDDGDCAIITAEGDGRICEMVTNVPDLERDANGCLQAAAPDMAEALQDAPAPSGSNWQEKYIEWYHVRCAALRKARGEVCAR